jgi:hypothetical protein
MAHSVARIYLGNVEMLDLAPGFLNDSWEQEEAGNIYFCWC